MVRVFETHYPLEANPRLEDVVKGKVMFYAHVFIDLGIERGLWTKVGKVPFDEPIDAVFGDYRDEKSIEIIESVCHEKIPSPWQVWKVNEEKWYVLSFDEVGQPVEYGAVLQPERVYYRMQTGIYPLVREGFPYMLADPNAS